MDLHRCRLNRTNSKRWEKTKIPAVGSTILTSGFLFGQDTDSIQLDIETLQFIVPTRGGDVSESAQTPVRLNFGVLLEFVQQNSHFCILLTVL
jgi:hypothetical protein